jgi:hypothetical protein
MPFGKNKALAMPRPKKTKVAAREEAPENTDDTGITGVEVPLPVPACPEQPLAPSPGRLKRKHAQDECDELRIEFLAAQELDADASKELTMQERLYEAKMKRIDKSQAGKRHGSPFGELERIYKAALALSDARWKREIAESSANNAEANWLAQQCAVLRLENAKLRRVMRANGVRAP